MDKNIFPNDQQPDFNLSTRINEALRVNRALRGYSQQPSTAQQDSPAMPIIQGPSSYSPMPSAQAIQPQNWNADPLQGRKMPTASRNLDQQPLAGSSGPPPLQQPQGRKRPQYGKPTVMKIVDRVMLIYCLLLMIIFSSGIASAYSYYRSQLPRLQGLENQQISQTSHIYDRNGVLLYDLYDNNAGGRRTYVAYKYIPQIMQQAIVAAEDHTFWTNPGIDPQGILRAAFDYVQHHNQVTSGGSTLTQQLIKNLTNNKQISINRKINEAALAIGLTQQFPKSKIMELYFNVSAFGAQELGVDAAAEDYFHLTSQCNAQHVCIPAIAFLDINAQGQHDPLLALARASLLAGMPQNPPSYDPTLGPDNKARALARQDEVLKQMLALHQQIPGLGTITPSIVQQAEALTAKMTFTPYSRNIRAPHFVYWVIQQLENQIGAETLLNGGFDIRTTIDINLESFVEKAVRRHLDQAEYQPLVGGYGPLNTVNNVNDSAVVVMNTKTGEVLAMNGSADFSSKDPRIGGEYNAALAYRQPGSSIKPIVYAAAFQMGWYPGIVLPDVKTYFPDAATGYSAFNANDLNSSYSPSDYGNRYNNTRGTIRTNIANSFNVPAVKAFEFAGIDNVVNMARRLGITAIDEDAAKLHKTDYHEAFGPALALGGAEVPLIQLTGAYQVFANQGVRIPPKGVLDMWDNYGHHLYHFDPTNPGGVQVISPQIAYLMTSILSDEPARAYEFAGDHALSMYDWQQTDGQKHEVAAKTGTTDNFKDNWTMGYTPDVVVGVWSGNANNEPLRNVIGITGAAPIWHSVIERASGACNIDKANIPCGTYHSPFTQQTFIVPPGVHLQAVSSVNGLEGTGTTDWMLDSEVPLQTGLSKTPCTGTPTPIPTPTPPIVGTNPCPGG